MCHFGNFGSLVSNMDTITELTCCFLFGNFVMQVAVCKLLYLIFDFICSINLGLACLADSYAMFNTGTLERKTDEIKTVLEG